MEKNKPPLMKMLLLLQLLLKKPLKPLKMLKLLKEPFKILLKLLRKPKRSTKSRMQDKKLKITKMFLQLKN